MGSCWGPLNRVHFHEKLETGRGVRLDVSLYQPPSFESEVSCVFSSTFALVLQVLLPKSDQSLHVLALFWHRVRQLRWSHTCSSSKEGVSHARCVQGVLSDWGVLGVVSSFPSPECPLARADLALLWSCCLEGETRVVLQRKSRCQKSMLHDSGGMRQVGREGGVLLIWSSKPHNTGSIRDSHALCPCPSRSSRRCSELFSLPLLLWILSPTLSFHLWPQSFGCCNMKGCYIVQ